MSAFKVIEGILVNKIEKTFEDGHKGFNCSLLTPEGEMVGFWSNSEYEKQLGEAHDVEGWDEDLCRKFRLEVKFWNGKTKLQYKPVIL